MVLLGFSGWAQRGLRPLLRSPNIALFKDISSSRPYQKPGFPRWPGGEYSKAKSGVATFQESMAVYKQFITMEARVQPGPTDPPGEPKNIVVSHLPGISMERVLDEIRRIVYTPDYVPADIVDKDTVESSSLVNSETGAFTDDLPVENVQMARVYKNWTISDDGRGLERVFRFTKTPAAKEFLLGLTKPDIERMDIGNGKVVGHHPAIAMSGTRVFVRWGTHQPSSISTFDIIGIAKTEKWARQCGAFDKEPGNVRMKLEIHREAPGSKS